MGHLTVKTGNIAGNLTKIFQKSQMPGGLPEGGRAWAVLELTGTLRAIGYRESHDRTENSDFFLLRQKDPFDELFSEIYFQSSSKFTFFAKSRKVRNIAQSTKMADGIYPKLYIFNTPVQKEGNLLGFQIHIVCNLTFGHSSELKFV